MTSTYDLVSILTGERLHTTPTPTPSNASGFAYACFEPANRCNDLSMFRGWGRACITNLLQDVAGYASNRLLDRSFFI